MQYTLFANTIEDNFRAHVQSIFEASRTLSQAITSAAIMVPNDYLQRRRLPLQCQVILTQPFSTMFA